MARLFGTAATVSGRRDVLGGLSYPVQIDGKKMSQQAFGILPKIREVDELLTANRTLVGRVVEVHPEVLHSRS